MNHISVIIPVYNAEPWLREALDSLLGQTYTDFEAILVDDGSTDGSAAICCDYCRRDPRFRLISRSNQGVSAARNAALDAAGGEWIAFLDADDTMPSYALRSLLTLALGSGAKITAGKYLRGIPVSIPPLLTDCVTVTSEEAIIIGLYQKRILNSPCGILFHRSIFNGEQPLRFRSGRYEDLDMFYRAFERAEKICLTDLITYFYRDNPGSFINTWSDARLDVLDVTKRITDHMRHKSPALLRAAEDRRFSAACNMAVEMLRHHVRNPARMRECLDIIRRHRLDELKDGNVRMKNKLGALLSYAAVPAIGLICR